jgi:hypothetical protein
LPRNAFNKVLLAAVEEGLASLGDSSKQAIFYHLESSFQIKKENIPANLTEFEKALEGIFGRGASYLETLIMQRLCDRLGLAFENERSSNFAACMENVRKRMEPTEELAT